MSFFVALGWVGEAVTVAVFRKNTAVVVPVGIAVKNTVVRRYDELIGVAVILESLRSQLGVAHINALSNYGGG